MPPYADPEIKVKSLGSALRLLDCFTQQTPEWGISELSRETGLCKSNVHSILSTYAALGYVERTDRDKYRLGWAFLRIAHVISGHLGFRQTIFPHMQEISSQINEVVYLGQPKNGQVIYLDAAYPDSVSGTRAMLGDIAPMYCTGLGKAMLATMPDEEIQGLLTFPLHQHTPCTLITWDELREDLAQTRARGYALDNMEHEFGVKCIAMAVRGKDGRAAFALSVSGPSLRFDEAAVSRIVALLKQKVCLLEEKFRLIA